MNEEQFDYALEEEEYGKLLVRLQDGSTIKGTARTTKTLADEVNDEERFLVLYDAVCKFADGRGSRQKVIFINKEHLLWVVPT
ncbi:MAG: hypothetical protein KKB70_03885 [Proteobacteria bacterium]|nr:hypothetical protein [Pseudomonadota bacterium]MBU1611832.1 hypothetical protein [Pseudomonadota bacterium]